MKTAPDIALLFQLYLVQVSAIMAGQVTNG